LSFYLNITQIKIKKKKKSPRGDFVTLKNLRKCKYYRVNSFPHKTILNEG